MSNGKYIILDGVDYSGKTTMAKRLVDWLRAKGTPAQYVRNPGATEIGRELRRITRDFSSDPITEALVFAADNSACIHEVIKPQLEKGVCVVADRNNFISGLAYQMASGCSLDDIDRVHNVFHNPPKADLLLILHASSEVIEKRAQVIRDAIEDTQNDRFGELMKKNPKYCHNVTNAYTMMATSKNADIQSRLLRFVKPTTTTPKMIPRCMGVNANHDQDNVFESIVKAVELLF